MPTPGNTARFPCVLRVQRIPPEAWEIARLMTEWVDGLNTAKNALHPIACAAMAHHRFVAIHPFIDGNGRTGRLIMNLLLMRAGYPPAVILKINRKQYYRVLAQADGSNPKPLVNFVGRAVERSLQLYVAATEPQTQAPAKQDEWLPLREAAQGTPYSHEYLSLLARLGRLRAIKRGRVWHTTGAAIEEYQRSVDTGKAG